MTNLSEIAVDNNRGFVDGPFGSNLPASDYQEAGVPVIRGTNLSLGTARFVDTNFVYVGEDTAKRLERSICVPDDIIFTKKGTLGQTGIVPKNHKFSRFLLSSNQMKLTVDRDKADPEFVYYYVSSKPSVEKIIRDAEATGVPKTNLAYLRTFPIVLPPVPEQQRIAAVLSTIDAKIEFNHRKNTALQTIAQAVFKDWFIDFGPTRTKAEGGSPYLPPELWSLFPEVLDIQGKPIGWETTSISAIATLNPESWSTQSYPVEIQYIDLSNTKWGVIETPQRFNKESAPSRAQRILRPGDTIVGTVRPGNGSYALIGIDGLTGSTGFAVLRPKESIYRELTYLIATDPSNIVRLTQLADGAAYPAVRPEAVAATEFVLAEHDLINSFSKKLPPYSTGLS